MKWNVIEYNHRKGRRANYKGYNGIMSSKDIPITIRWFVHIKESHSANQVTDQRSATTSS